MESKKKFGALGFTMRDGDQIICDSEIVFRITKTGPTYIKVSVLAPVDVNVQSVIRKSGDNETRSWRREK